MVTTALPTHSGFFEPGPRTFFPFAALPFWTGIRARGRPELTGPRLPRVGRQILLEDGDVQRERNFALVLVPMQCAEELIARHHLDRGTTLRGDPDMNAAAAKRRAEIRLDACYISCCHALFRAVARSGGADRSASAGLDVRNLLTQPRLQHITQHANRLT